VTRDPSEYENPSDAEVEIDQEIPEEATSPDLHFPCANCGAELTWHPDADAMVCGHCDTRVDVPVAEGTFLERPLSEAGEAARGLGLERRVLQCDTCGATVSLDEIATAEICAYCGSSNVLDQEGNRNAIRPESLIPLDVSTDTAHQAFRRWISRLWFRPNGLKRTSRLEAMGVYVPFWTFDSRVHSEWSADAGYYYYVTQSYWTTVDGKRVRRTRRVRKIRWEPAWGSRDDAYDDILINASRGLPPDLVEQLGRFDLHALVPYQPQYLAGWRAEEYQIDLLAGWEHAQEEVEKGQWSRCRGDVPGDTHRDLRVRNTISDVRYKHVLLPIWVLHYRFRERAYTVLIHGQTGRIVGKAPYSWVKISLFILFILAAIVIGLLLIVVVSAAG
jgi:DNA-directed RNA polymerase subunit RPC12/RpoP